MTNPNAIGSSDNEQHTSQNPTDPKEKEGMQQNDDPGSAPESGDKEPE
ncbi:hypothetical protein Q3V30_06305 [Erwinia pyri]|uniref:Uncharacterized protein n=1 Tax=Erwinia pyri TaxID=3062598 RepID=A0AA50HND5_9GAMM|nr:hypothetical protein [Erwinia sp. DE2]WLS80091.1 hypothetical protein Q3V30_06305 [Erwinia sp. DE2]